MSQNSKSCKGSDPQVRIAAGHCYLNVLISSVANSCRPRLVHVQEGYIVISRGMYVSIYFPELEFCAFSVSTATSLTLFPVRTTRP